MGPLKTTHASDRRHPFSTRIWMMVFIILYNLVMIMGLVVAGPVLAALVASSEKRRRTFRQRLGWWTYPWEREAMQRGGPAIWVHALSVGEVAAVQPLVRQLRRWAPGSRIMVTTSTLTGHQTARRLLGGYGVDLAYFPYDLIWGVRKIINKINPKMVILVETDFWPNFLMETARRHIPVSIVNLRLSPTSWKRLAHVKPLSTWVLAAAEIICVQTRRDARRLVQLGISEHRIAVTGSLKFDSPIPDTDPMALTRWRRKFSIETRSRVVVAGSTHENEELMVLKACTDFLKRSPSALLILAPRDPGRAGRVMELCADLHLGCACLSTLNPDGASPFQVVVVDAIGHLKTLYSLADIAFVGGSLVPRGGHNPLEPAAFGKPVLFGRHMEDFKHIADLLIEAGGARQVQDADQLEHVLKRLMDDPGQCQRMGRKALAVLQTHRGAVQRTLSCLGFSG